MTKHRGTLELQPEEVHACLHAGHVWCSIQTILKVLKIDRSYFHRKYLNVHSLFDETAVLMMQYLFTHDLSQRQFQKLEKLLAIGDCSFGQRHLLWVKLDAISHHLILERCPEGY